MAMATEIDLRVVYGLGGVCAGRFPREGIEGLSVRELVRRVTERPQPPGPAARTARVLADVLRSGRELDTELVYGSSDGTGDGRPISLDQVVVRERRDAPSRSDTDEWTIRISESYRGGDRYGVSRCEEAKS